MQRELFLALASIARANWLSWNYLSLQMTQMKIVYFINDLFCRYKNTGPCDRGHSFEKGEYLVQFY